VEGSAAVLKKILINYRKFYAKFEIFYFLFIFRICSSVETKTIDFDKISKAFSKLLEHFQQHKRKHTK